MERATEWFDRDDFWATFEPYLFHEERLAATPAEVDAVLARLEPSPGAQILDLCCGPGRHTLEFARRGFAPTGVDRTPAYLERARRAAEEEGLTVEWIAADMRDFRRPGTFDAAVNLYTSFGYFEDPEEDRRVLANLHASLRPGGRLLMEMMSKEVLARIFRERDWRRYPDGSLLLEERRLAADWSRVTSTWILLRDGERCEFELTLRLYAASELGGLLRAAGFHTVYTWGNFAGDPYDARASRLVVMAEA